MSFYEEEFSVFISWQWYRIRSIAFDHETEKGKIEMDFAKEIILLSILMGLMFIGLYKVSEHGN